MKYRAEIDGLRAVAVIAVILYHAEIFFHEIKLFKGGFVGVDIFFVISGYLITSIILKEMDEGKFSYANFYERRARRILPALFVVIFASIPFAWIYMLPKAMKEYAGSILSSLAFGSNIWFLWEDNYFAEASIFKPFLHTWTLSVEEQFYLIYPVILLLLWKYAKRAIFIFFILLFFISLSLAHYYSGIDQFTKMAFYLLPMRGWELLAGAMLAKEEFRQGKRSNGPLLSSIMPVIGFGLICYAVLFFDSNETMRSSLMMLLPVVGAGLIIWYGKSGEFVSNILGSKPFVAIGLISYGIYLWHAPIFAFARISGQDNMLGCVLLTFVLSFLMYITIEKNFRNRNLLKTRTFVALTMSAFIGLIGVQLFFYMTNGALFRLGKLQTMYESTSQKNLVQGNQVCHNSGPDTPCEFMVPGSQYTIINLGDSHADVLGVPLKTWARSKGLSYVHLTSSACIFFMDAGVVNVYCGRA